MLPSMIGLEVAERFAGVVTILLGVAAIWLLRSETSKVNALGAGSSLSLLGATGMVDSVFPLHWDLLLASVSLEWVVMGVFVYRATRNLLVLLAFAAVPALIGLRIVFP